MILRKISDLLKEGDIFAKVLIYGANGTGKTCAAAMPAGAQPAVGAYPAFAGESGDNVYVLVTEPQSKGSILEVNPNAMVVIAEDVKEVVEFVEHAEKERFPVGSRLVFDGITEIQRLIRDRLTPESGEFDDWSTLNEQTRRLLRRIRALPYHTVVTALEAIDTERNDKKRVEIRHITPSLEGKKLQNEIGEFFAAVGRLGKYDRKGHNGEDIVDHFITWSSTDVVMCKPAAPMPSKSKQNVGDVIRCMLRAVDPSSIKFVPVVSQTAVATSEKPPATLPDEEGGKGRGGIAPPSPRRRIQRKDSPEVNVKTE